MVNALTMPALNSCGRPTAGSVMPLGVVYWPVVTHSTEHMALARPGEFLMESFQPFTAQPTRISSRMAEPPGRICCTNEKYGSSSPVGFVAPRAGTITYVYGPVPVRTTLPSENAIAHARISDEAYFEISKVGMLQCDLKSWVGNSCPLPISARSSSFTGTFAHGLVLRFVCRQTFATAQGVMISACLPKLQPCINSFMLAI